MATCLWIESVEQLVANRQLPSELLQVILCELVNGQIALCINADTVTENQYATTLNTLTADLIVRSARARISLYSSGWSEPNTAAAIITVVNPDCKHIHESRVDNNTSMTPRTRLRVKQRSADHLVHGVHFSALVDQIQDDITAA
jgi:hypothetical protein